MFARSDRSDPGRVFGVANDITERKRLERALAEATHKEQARLGLEIHDGLGQELTGLAYLASCVATAAGQSGSPLAADLQQLSKIAARTIETCRDIARGVSPLTESRGSLVHSVRKLAEGAAAAGHVSVNFQAKEAAPLTLPWEARDHLHRIAQEALSNAQRHAGGNHIEVTLDIGAKLVRLAIIDNGRGFNPRKAPKGLGIDSMRQRAAAIGGRLRLQNVKHGGTAVVCECRQLRAAAKKSA